MKNRTVYIYAMVDPRDQLIKYVGQTVNLKTRYTSLTTPSSISCSYAMRAWAAEIRAAKKKPIMIILEQTDQTNAGKVELKWIMTFLEAGAPLLNQQLYEAYDYRESANWWNEEKYRFQRVVDSDTP